MNIGVDLDGVIFDSEREIRVYSELYDMLENKEIENRKPREWKLKQRFNWDDDKFIEFWKRHGEIVIKESNYMPGAKKVLKLLKDEGHKLIIITGRGKDITEAIDLTIERLKKDNFEIFDKYYWRIERKEEICLKENIDLMIDDWSKQCENVSNAGIKSIYFRDAISKEIEENENLITLYNWGEIYRYIKYLEDKKN